MPSPECAASLSGSRQSRNSITDGPLGSSGRELQPHFFHDLPRRRHQPDDDLRSPVDNRLAVHENLVLAIASRDRIHLDPQLTAEARRHTDGMYSRDSERAITNRYSGHGSLPFGPHLLRNKLRDCPFRNRDRSGTARVEPEVGWRARHPQDHGITTRTSQPRRASRRILRGGSPCHRASPRPACLTVCWFYCPHGPGPAGSSPATWCCWSTPVTWSWTSFD